MRCIKAFAQKNTRGVSLLKINVRKRRKMYAKMTVRLSNGCLLFEASVV